MKYQYCLAYDDGNILIRRGLEKAEDGYHPLDRYDVVKGKWVEDLDMCGIYSGDIPVIVITEKEANKCISALKNGSNGMMIFQKIVDKYFNREA